MNDAEWEDQTRIIALLKPHYMALYGGPGNGRSGQSWEETLHETLARITPDDISLLLHAEDWRPRLTGAYFCGFKKWDDFQLDIGRLLLNNTLCFTPSGYAFALARFGSHASANYLRGYLNQYLKNPNNWYDWIGEPFAALQWLDQELGASHAEDYEGLLLRHIERVIELNWDEADRHSAEWWADDYARYIRQMESIGQEPLSPEEYAEIKDPNPGKREQSPAQTAVAYLMGAHNSMWQLMTWCRKNGY